MLGVLTNIHNNLDFIKHIEVYAWGFNWFMLEVLIEIKMTDRSFHLEQFDPSRHLIDTGSK